MLTLTNVRPTPLLSLGINPDSAIFATDCQFDKGCRYMIEAPSGRGKSTLLHLVYGLRDDYEGTIHFKGDDIRIFSPDHWARLRQESLSIVFQDLRLFPELTAMENILVKNQLTGYKSEIDIKAMAEKLNVGELLGRTTGTLSYGQQQRIAIIRSLCQPFEFLLLDEPFSHLDAANTQAALQLIQEESDFQEAAVIVVSLGEDFGMGLDEVKVL